MNVQNTDLDRLQAAFKATFDAWIDAIRLQEQLASVDRSLAQVYLRENSHFLAENARHSAGVAKTSL